VNQVEENLIKPIIVIAIITIILLTLRAYKKKKMQIKQCKYFQISEFDSPDVPGSGKNMQHSTLLMLCEARKIAGIPFIINSGYRTKLHNQEVGGVTNSAHLIGCATDISTTSKTQVIILKALKQAGFKRFGIYSTFIHVDNDSTKTQFTYWGNSNINPFNLA